MIDQFGDCNTFDKSLGKLSAISHVSRRNQKSQNEESKPLEGDNYVELMNEELMMEFQLEQMLA